MNAVKRKHIFMAGAERLCCEKKGGGEGGEKSAQKLVMNRKRKSFLKWGRKKGDVEEVEGWRDVMKVEKKWTVGGRPRKKGAVGGGQGSVVARGTGIQHAQIEDPANTG